MNEIITRAQATIRAMKLMSEALEDIGERLPEDPRLYALLAESPLEDLRRMRDELDHYFAELKQVATAASAP